jgi:CDP-diacylglycerol--serine O-phosphatidyltransferase
MHFKGLPSPAAAATVAAVVLLWLKIQSSQENLRWSLWLNRTVGMSLPIITAAVALLMVSRFRYPHLVNRFVVGRKPVSYILKALVVVLLGILRPQWMLAIGTLGFAISGPVGALLRRFFPHPPVSAAPGPTGPYPPQAP